MQELNYQADGKERACNSCRGLLEKHHYFEDDDNKKINRKVVNKHGREFNTTTRSLLPNELWLPMGIVC